MTQPQSTPPNNTGLDTLPIKRTDLTIDFSESGPNCRHAHIEIAAKPLAEYLSLVEATGEEVDGRTISAALIKFCIGEAMQQADFRTIFGPQLDLESPPSVVKSGQPFVCNLLIDTFPEIDWPDFETITLKRPVRVVSQEMIDGEVMQQCLSVGQQSAKDGLLARGDHAVCTIRMSVDADTVLLEQTDVDILIPQSGANIVLFGQEMPSLADHFLKTTIGQTVALDINIPDTHPDVSLRGKLAVLNIGVTAGYTIIPGTIDDVLAALELKTEGMLRMQIDVSLNEKAVRDQKEILTDQFFQALIERVDIPIPTQVVQRAVQQETQAIGQRMAAQGVPQEEIMDTLKQGRDARTTASRNSAKRTALTKLLNQDFEIVTSELSIGHYIAGLAANLGRRPEDLRREIMDHGAMLTVTARVQELTCFESLAPQLTIEDVPAEEWTDLEDSQAL